MGNQRYRGKQFPRPKQYKHYQKKGVTLCNPKAKGLFVTNPWLATCHACKKLLKDKYKKDKQ